MKYFEQAVNCKSTVNITYSAQMLILTNCYNCAII